MRMMNDYLAQTRREPQLTAAGIIAVVGALTIGGFFFFQYVMRKSLRFNRSSWRYERPHRSASLRRCAELGDSDNGPWLLCARRYPYCRATSV